MPVQRQHTDNAWGGLLLSLLLHAALAGLAIFGAMVFPGMMLGGQHTGGSAPAAMHAGLVTRLPGSALPLPAPTPAPTLNRLATSNPAPGISRPHPAAAARDAIVIPDSLAAAARAQQQLMLDQERLAHTDARPDDRVAYGNRGAVSANAGSKNPGAAPGGITFGDAGFGSRYAAWVNHLRDRLEISWENQVRFHPSLRPGKVMISFSVDRGGNITGISMSGPSGQQLLDSSGQSAIQSLIGHETFPLPADYGHSRLDVGVTFELP